MKIIVTIVITAVVVLFSMQNFEHVPVYYFGGKPIHIRLIFVIAISMVFGYFIRYIASISKEEELKRKCRELMVNHNKLRRKFSQEDEEEF
jgi:uncharacterized integral membrane protein